MVCACSSYLIIIIIIIIYFLKEYAFYICLNAYLQEYIEIQWEKLNYKLKALEKRNVLRDIFKKSAEVAYRSSNYSQIMK